MWVEHQRVLALRWLWKDDAIKAVVEFLENTTVGIERRRRGRGLDAMRIGKETRFRGRRARRTGQARPS